MIEVLSAGSLEKEGKFVLNEVVYESGWHYLEMEKINWVKEQITQTDRLYTKSADYKSTVSVDRLFKLYEEEMHGKVRAYNAFERFSYMRHGDLFIMLDAKTFSDDDEEETPFLDIRVTVTGRCHSQCDAVLEFFKKNTEGALSFLKWKYMGRHGINSHIIQLENDATLHDESYPYLENGVENYITEYLNSDSPVLILMGPPGTGKTSFIKHMIASRNLKGTITYDEKVYNSEDFYIEFVKSKDENILVIEDADTIIQSREKFDNKGLSRLLNITDGVFKKKGKKVVFSTNIQSKESIDSALIRPGRTFDLVNFRSLTEAEAEVLCQKIGNTLPGKKKNYTLAEVFNKKSHIETKIGFR